MNKDDPRLSDAAPATPGWYWKQTHWDNWDLIGPKCEMRKYRGPHYVTSDSNPPFSFRTYANLCWWCGTHGINATQV